MSDHSAVSVGWIPACRAPEGSRDPFVSFEAGRTCRACLIAGIAHAVNLPNEPSERTATGRTRRACVVTLEIVRELLDECDPLRVRAEQALLPLVRP